MTVVVARLRRDQRGFTLIEILVVVMIIGILASIVTLSVNVLGEDNEMERATERLADAIALVQEQAQLEGRDYGMRIETGGYEFLHFDGFEQRWIEVKDDPWLRPRELPAGLAFELVIEGRPVLLRRQGLPAARLPQLIAYGSGDMTPYRLSLARADAGRRVTLIGSPDGTIEIERDALN